MQVQFYELTETNNKLKYVVIQAKYQGKWIFVRHRQRSTWEIPGGHIEDNETPFEAAKRELREETGAIKFSLKPICDYSVTRDSSTNYGRLYFSEVEELGNLGEYEMEERIFCHELPHPLTYEEIQPFLFERVLKELQ